MAGQDRLAPPDVSALDALALLASSPERFELFQALRLFEAGAAEQPRLGEARRARDERLRLAQPPHLFMAPSTIASFSAPVPGRPGRLSTFAFGLFGPQGPLPLHITRHALQRLRQEQDPTLAEFANIFHHRLMALFWRAHARARPVIEHDRPRSDRFARRLGAVAGLATPSMFDRSPLPDRFVLFAAGLLTLQHRPPEALIRLVALFFRVPVAITEFVGAWLDIPLAAQTRLGLPQGASLLGVDAVVGRRAYARHHRFRIVLGPLGLVAYLRFLPVGDALPKLGALVRHAVGLDHDWDVQLVLKRDEVPTARLDGATMLGWTSWLSARQRLEDADDLVLLGSARA
jgi:type VI secretion system protein ImpH